MAFYRTEDGSSAMHVNFGRKPGPAQCVSPALEMDNHKIGERCGRMSVALCDFPVGKTLGGRPLTCDAPMCAHHRTSVGPNIDYCPRHPKPLKLPLGE
jgi:hypothetical protein